MIVFECEDSTNLTGSHCNALRLLKYMRLMSNIHSHLCFLAFFNGLFHVWAVQSAASLFLLQTLMCCMFYSSCFTAVPALCFPSKLNTTDLEECPFNQNSLHPLFEESSVVFSIVQISTKPVQHLFRSWSIRGFKSLQDRHHRECKEMRL